MSSEDAFPDSGSNSRKRSHTEAVSAEEQLSSNEIISIVTKIKQATGNAREKQRQFRKQYTEFADKYPSLFQMACEPDFDIKRLEFMLSMRDNVGNNRISQHQASVKVGENLFQQYVKPLVDKAEAQKKKETPE